MPLGKGVRYRVKHTKKGNVRLAFKGNRVVETKNLKTGETHTEPPSIRHLRKRHKA